MPFLDRIPRLWDGETVFILGGGPSLSLIDLDSLRDQRVIAVNCSCADAPWADVMFFGDGAWIRRHEGLLANFGGIILTHREEIVRWGDHPGILVLRRQSRQSNNPGLSDDPRYIVWNWNSGAASINIAVHLGAAKIVLLGFDMRHVDGRSNYHNLYGGPEKRKAFDVFLDGPSPQKGSQSVFEAIARDAQKMGVEIVNATPGSAITTFPIVSPADLGIARQPEKAGAAC